MNNIFKKNPVLAQIIKFGLIGTLNFAVDISIYIFLTRKIFIYYLLAHVIAFLIANLMSFALNKNFAFQDKTNNKIFIKYMKFLGFTVFSLIISAAVLFICVNYLKIFDIYGKIMGTIVAATWNFLMYKFIVFSHKSTV